MQIRLLSNIIGLKSGVDNECANLRYWLVSSASIPQEEARIIAYTAKLIHAALHAGVSVQTKIVSVYKLSFKQIKP